MNPLQASFSEQCPQTIQELCKPGNIPESSTITCTFTRTVEDFPKSNYNETARRGDHYEWYRMADPLKLLRSW